MTVMTAMQGKRFGRLVVERRAVRHRKNAFWVCLCDCGVRKTIDGRSLRLGRQVSCGCHRIQKATIHGHTAGKSSRTYLSWVAMRGRCEDPSNISWEYYGARGIKVCERWGKFENFVADMGERPAGKTLDRYPDVNGDYKLNNCRWATSKEQAANRRPRTTEARL